MNFCPEPTMRAWVNLFVGLCLPVSSVFGEIYKLYRTYPHTSLVGPTYTGEAFTIETASGVVGKSAWQIAAAQFF